MKQSYLILIVLSILIASCGDSKEKKEIDKKNRKLKALKEKNQKRNDSIKILEAFELYKKQEWDSALVSFNKIVSNSKYYVSTAKGYIEQINNRPWQESDYSIKESVKGKFSNSATKDSPLWVDFKITYDGTIYLYMYEYSNSKPSNRSAEKPMYDFSLLVSGYKAKFLCFNIRPSYDNIVSDATHSEGISISGSLSKKVINMLKKSSGEVYFRITMGSSSTYSFYLPSEGFTKAYNLLRKK